LKWIILDFGTKTIKALRVSLDGQRMLVEDFAQFESQKDYFKGGGSLWEHQIDHQTKLQQKEFTDYRSEVVRKQDQIPGEDVRSVGIKLANGSKLNIFLKNLEFSDDAEQKRIDHLTAMQSSNARGSIISGPTDTTSDTRIIRVPPNKFRGTEEPDNRNTM
jgi:hypothetical protein